MLGALVTVIREFLTFRGCPRIPEPEMVMRERVTVDSYARAGEPGGGLSGNYAFTADQMSEVFAPGDVVLDVGCGPARLLCLLARLNPEVQFIGVDLSDEMLARGREAVEEGKLDNVELRRDDMMTLASVDDRAVSAVLSHMALHHLPDVAALDRCLAAMARVLHPGGGVCLSDLTRFQHPATASLLEETVSREDPVGGREFGQSLRAAFSRAELTAAATRHFGGSVRVYGSRISLFLMVKSPPRRDTHPGRAALQQMVRELPPSRRAELRSMQVPLRVAGLRSQL
jgi:SAM-dependent methyltransferase